MDACPNGCIQCATEFGPFPNQEYTITNDAIEFSFEDISTPTCTYTYIYEIIDVDTFEPLSFEDTLRNFEVFSDNKDFLGNNEFEVYQIQLTAIPDDPNSPSLFTAFDLTVRNPCWDLD